MKKILIIAALIGIGILLFVIQDPEKDKQEALASIYENVLLKDSADAQSTCAVLKDTLSQSTPGERSEALNNAFANLVLAWKRVETNYVLGDLDSERIDTPRFIDIFHVGNESIAQQMEKVIHSSSQPKTALYKHSYKTINALEYLLYKNNDISERKLALSIVVAENICHRLDQIYQSYREKETEFLADSQKALSLLINILAERTFETKDWRVGDPAGLTKKYEGQVDPNRGEYSLSGLSMPAVKAILEAQASLVLKQSFANLNEIVIFFSAEQQLMQSSELLTQSQAEENKINTLYYDFNPDKTRSLYDSLNKLQTSYYGNLLQSLNVTAKILEADGD
ncbi:imelysin family protein [Suttonella ornithocola]|uniref:Predicted periplasmic lipoprotein n=1 Tax=Suttonella ornithocola TaxID=279832 RepID=A0A380MX98_9GAMM|nr:imelysin family protein [Suttonella ornithocola]SUO97189.1 Predicted periplasmic lipoprotein [Suttonella ornithocola]